MLLFSLLSCSLTARQQSPTFDSVYTVVTSSQQIPNVIPAPTNTPILTITGNFNATQEGVNASIPSISMDRSLIEAVGTVEYTVKDPFEREDTTFQGVLFRDLLSLWQVPETAQQLTITALNDYQVQVPVALLKEYPVLLAFKQNGQVMTRDYRGPAMLVTPIDQYPNVPELTNREYWAWQISTIHIE